MHRTAARPSSLLQISHSLVRPCSSTRLLLSNALGYLLGAPVLSCVRRAMLADEANSYLIIIKSLLPNVVASLYHDLSSPDTNPPAWALSGRIWISLLMAVLVPLSYLRRLDSLRHASYIALFSCGECHIFLPQKVNNTDLVTCFLLSVPCFDSCIVLFSPHRKHDATWGDPFNQVHTQLCLYIPYTSLRFHLLTECENYFFYGSTLVTDFRDGQLFPIFNELKSNSQKRMNIVIGTAIGSTTLTYEVIAVFGYLTFGSHVRFTYI